MKKPFGRSLFAAILAGILAGAPATPVLAQEPSQAPPAKGAPLQGGLPIALGVEKYHYTHSPSLFPNITAPYRAQNINPGTLVNSPRLEQLIEDGKLSLSLQDAIALAMENSMDIVVQRYNPWMADASILKTEAGGFGFAFPIASRQAPQRRFPPSISTRTSPRPSLADTRFPVNNPLISGTGSTTLSSLAQHTDTYNTNDSQDSSDPHHNQRILGQHALFLFLHIQLLQSCRAIHPGHQFFATIACGVWQTSHTPQHFDCRKQPQDRRPGFRAASHYHRHQHCQRLLGACIRARKREGAAAGRDRIRKTL